MMRKAGKRGKMEVKKRKTILLIILGALILSGAGGDFRALAADDEITFPVKLFASEKARHFSYKVESKSGKNLTIRYFILKSSDGVIRAAFDACDVCWPEGKGYFQKDDFMVCRNCGRSFSSVRINEVQGGCNPVPLKREIRGDKVVIKVKDLLTGARYFDFGERRR